MRQLTRRNHTRHVRLIILAVVVVGGFAAGPLPSCFPLVLHYPEICFFFNLGHVSPFSPNFYWCTFFIAQAVNLGIKSFPQLCFLAFVIVLKNWPRNVSKFCSLKLTNRLHYVEVKSALFWISWSLGRHFEFVCM